MPATATTARRRLLLLAALLAAAMIVWAVWVNTAARWHDVCAGTTAAHGAQALTVTPFCVSRNHWPVA